MSLWGAIAIALSGVGAGLINTIVGSGTLITFPTLLAFGIPPVVANASNSVGLAPGSLSGAIGYRRELRGQRSRLIRLGVASLIGGIIGALALLYLPSSVFDAAVPVLIMLGVVLVVVGPALQRKVAKRAAERGGLPEHGAPWVMPSVIASGIYGGYFGAAQGVLLMAILGIGVDDTMQRHNATKNVLAMLVNGIAAVIFVFVVKINWLAAGLIAFGAVIGAQIGARVGRKLPPNVLRAVIAVGGTVAAVHYLLT